MVELSGGEFRFGIWGTLSREATVQFKMGSGPELDWTGPKVWSGLGSGSAESEFSGRVWFGVHLMPDLLRTQSRPNWTPNLMI